MYECRPREGMASSEGGDWRRPSGFFQRWARQLNDMLELAGGFRSILEFYFSAIVAGAPALAVFLLDWSLPWKIAGSVVSLAAFSFFVRRWVSATQERIREGIRFDELSQ